MDENILERSFSRVERKKLGICAFLSVLLIILSLLTVWKPYIVPLPLFEVIQPKKFEPFLVPICKFSEAKSDFCEIKGDIRIQGNSSSIFFTSVPQLVTRLSEDNATEWTIKLYARKTDKNAMVNDKALFLKPALSDQEMPRCTVSHTIPAVVFSARGYAGNLFHDFSDTLIPLYLTSRGFNGEVQFLIELKHEHGLWWVNKYNPILKALSKYEIITLDDDRQVHCFKKAIIGLKSHKDFDIDPEKPPLGNSLRSFTHLVRKAYSLNREDVIKLIARKPRLLIISRKGSRSIVNEDEIAAEAMRLGFNVEAMEITNELIYFSKKVNDFDVMMGVHGAGLTNMVFLPENAVTIQVVPLGLEWLSKAYYEKPAKDMNVKYLEYKISINESSLIEEYPTDHPVITDINSIKKEGYLKFKSIYMDSQNVRLDVSKFRGVLLEALQLLNS